MWLTDNTIKSKLVDKKNNCCNLIKYFTVECNL